MPDNYISITASGTPIGYQWFAGEQVASLAKLSPWATKDPLDATMYITYSVNLTQNKMQAMAFLEDSSTATAYAKVRHLTSPYQGEGYNIPLLTKEGLGEVFPTANASSTSDYSKRYPTTIGDGLGILVDSSTGANIGKPAQEIQSIIASGSLDIAKTSDEYRAYFSKSDSITGTGTNLQSLQLSYRDGVGINAPTTCPTGFIPVPGNKEFYQPGFCVSKYAMTYSDADVPDSTWGGATWNTMHYNSAKIPVSIPNKYPIADINQPQAITACQSMGKPGEYHLITNNEWMTVARNIEQVGDNWSTGIVGSGGLYRGITGEGTSTSTSLGCNTIDTFYGSGSRTYVAKPLANDTTKFWTKKGTDCDSKRQHKLSNSQIVWDMAGNIWSHVNKGNTLDGTNFSGGLLNKDTPNLSSYTSYSWSATGWEGATGDMRKLYGPSQSAYGTGAGMGNIYQHNVSTTANIFIRGGDAWDAMGAGVFTLDLSWDSLTTYRGVGFRCVR